MDLTLTGDELHRLDGDWPRLCCGCGGPPTARYAALIRATEPRTVSLELPSCEPCARRGELLRALWAAACALVVGLEVVLIATRALAPFDAEGHPVGAVHRALAIASTVLFILALLLGAPVYFVSQRRLGPARVSELDGEDVDACRSITITCRSAAFVEAARRRLETTTGGPQGPPASLDPDPRAG